MMQVPLEVIPNQEFKIVLDQNLWDFTIKETNGCMSVSLSLNGTQLINGARAVAGVNIINYAYLQAGDFFFVTNNNQIPDYTQFGTSQYLIYISPDELAANNVVYSFPITAEDFDPIAALPMRFAPTW